LGIEEKLNTYILSTHPLPSFSKERANSIHEFCHHDLKNTIPTGSIISLTTTSPTELTKWTIGKL